MALGLQVFELGLILLAMLAETAFLNAEIRELPLISDKNLRIDERGLNGRVGAFELIGELDATEGVDAHFERGDAKQTPFGIGERLDERVFGVGAGLLFGEEAPDVLFVRSSIITRQQNGAASESGFDGVEGRNRAAFRCFGTGRELRIRLIRKDLSVR